jgi:hypothetical protein
MLLGLVLPGLALADDKPPPDPPELKKTIDALAGHWKLKTTFTGPDGKGMTVPETIDCARAGMGKSLTCVDKLEIPGAGKAEYDYLIGYDVDTKSVHLFAVGSMGEVHDHKGAWKDDKTLVFEPLTASLHGAPLTEAFSMSFDKDNLTMTGTVTDKTGVTKLDITGKRGK